MKRQGGKVERRDGDVKRLNGRTAVGRKIFGLEPNVMIALGTGLSNLCLNPTRAVSKEPVCARGLGRR